MTRTQEPMTPDYRQEWSWKTMNKMPDLAEQLAVEMTNATLPERIKIADRYLEQAELRVGGGATLDDLYDVARAAENDLQDIRNKTEWIFGFFEWQDYLRQTPPKQEVEK